RGLGDVAPGEGTGPLDAASAERLSVGRGALDPCCDLGGVERVDEDGGSVRDLLRCAAAARHDCGAARHRLQHRNPETLVDRRVRDTARAAIEAGELLVRDAAEPADPVAADVDPAPAALADDPQLDADEAGRLDEARQVL